MLQLEHEIDRKGMRFSVRLRPDGARIVMLNNTPRQKWFWVNFTAENFPSFRQEFIDLTYGHNQREVATFDQVTGSEGWQGLKLYIKKSWHPGWFDLKIMNEPERPLFEMEFRDNELTSLFDQLAFFFMS